MKKSELKDLIKPIVEECVRDALLTSGLLSSIISEVVGGLTDGRNASHIVERREHSQVQPEPVKPPVNKKKLLDAIGQDAYNGIDVFEGTKPLKSAGKPRQSGSGGYSPFDGVDPSDPGVDISALTRMAGKNWKRLAEGNK